MNIFGTVGRHLADSLPPHTGQLFTEYLLPPTKSSMFCNPTTPYEVFRIIIALNINKSPGPDNIGLWTYMSQTCDQQRFTISEVAADWL